MSITPSPSSLAAFGDAMAVPGAVAAALAAAALVAAAFGLGSRLPRWAPRWILRAMDAHPLGHLEAPAFRDTVRRMARLFHVREPALYVVPHPQANLFVFVDHDGVPALVATQGVLDALDPPELEAAVGAALARAGRRDLTRSTVAAGLGLALTSAAGFGMVRGDQAERFPLGWPLGVPLVLLGAALARAVGGPVPCGRTDLRGASVSGRSEECARLLEHMEYTAHVAPMALPAAVSRLGLVHPRGTPGRRGLAGLFPAPQPAALRAALLRGAFPPGDPSRARAA